MGILLAFAPFLVFVVAERLVGVAAGLVTASIVSAMLVGKDVIAGRQAKVLEMGTLLLLQGWHCTRISSIRTGP